MQSVSKLLKSSTASALFICVLAGLLLMAVRGTGNLELLELGAYDWYTRLLPKYSESNPRIVLVGITENDIRNQGLWPLPDATIARALETLTRYQARAIGVDIYRDLPVPPGREELDSVLIANPRIIATMKFGSGGIPPPAVLEGTKQIGFNDMAVDMDGVVRRALLFMDDGETVAQSFALRLALLYLKDEKVAVRRDPNTPECIRVGQNTIRPLEANDGGYRHADARGYQFLIDFKDNLNCFKSISLTSLLSGEVPPEQIKDKVVILGVEAQDVKDFFQTPYSRSLKDGEEVSGPALHAHVVSQLIRFGINESRPIRTAGGPQETFWIFFWCFVGGAVGFRIRSPWYFAVAISGSLLTLVLLTYGAFMIAWWIPLVPPSVALVGSAGMVTAYVSHHENRQRSFLMHLFARHVSKEVAENIWLHRDKFLDGGRPRPMKLMVTILFSDLKGFTPISERMDPLALIDWLNIYMEKMATLVSQHGGVIDDYAGDGIKADFGIPVPRGSEEEIGQDAVNAVNCALAMEAAVQEMNSLWREQNLPTVGLRVGILTGPVVAGALGSAQRLKFTTVGSTVNAASRLESYDKAAFHEERLENPCRILIGEATYAYVHDRFETLSIGKANLKGLEEPVAIYRVTGRKSHENSQTEEVGP